MKKIFIAAALVLTTISAQAETYVCSVVQSSGLLYQAVAANIKIDEKFNARLSFAGSNLQNTVIIGERVSHTAGHLKIRRKGPDAERRTLILNTDGSGSIELKDGSEIYAAATLSKCIKQ